MKKLILFSLATITLLWMGCGQQADINSMLKNAETKDNVFTAILDDHELMTEFMTKMMSHEHAKMMMKGDKDMMGMMMGEGNMMKMMKTNPEMMHNMMGDMMKDGKTMEHMMQMMNQDGMMSDECMESCMKTMTDQGMTMEMGKMGDNGTGADKKDDSHGSGSHH